MGKKDKNKEDVPNPMSVTNRDILQRLNFLYQASVLLNGLALPQVDTSNTTTTGTDPDIRPQPSQTNRKKHRRVVHVEELSRSYIETMKTVGQKTNVKLDPSVKRRICKCCSAPLIPGITASVRVKDSASHGHLVSYQCHRCQTERHIPAPPVLHMDMEPPTNEETMQVQSEASTSPVTMNTANTVRPRQRRKKGPKPRLPPHFARDVGHVVFRGTEVLDTLRSIS